MALAADANYTEAGSKVLSFKLTDAVVAYRGALIGINLTTGFAVLWSDATDYNVAFLGLAMRRSTGDATPDPGKDRPEVEVDCSGVVLKKLSVTGASTQTQVGDRVYSADDNSFSLSATAGGRPIGFVTRLYNSGAAIVDVQLLTPAEFRALVGS
jgi:hypothetical protein